MKKIKDKSTIRYLTHYTKVDSLELILNTQSFRFSRVTGLNDNNEGMCTDDLNTSYMLYSSSWCEDTSEKGIEYMWENYGDNSKEVKILAPKDIFEKYKFSDSDKKIVETYLPDRYHQEFVWNFGDEFLWEIEYTDDLSKIRPSIKSYDNHWECYRIQELSKYKEKKWEIEREWRYGLALVHRGLHAVPKELREIAIEMTYPKNIDLKFKCDVYEKLKVKLGENISKEDKIRVYNMQEKYKIQIIE